MLWYFAYIAEYLSLPTSSRMVTVSESKVITPVELNRLSPTLNTSSVWVTSGSKFTFENSIYYCILIFVTDVIVKIECNTHCRVTRR